MSLSPERKARIIADLGVADGAPASTVFEILGELEVAELHLGQVRRQGDAMRYALQQIRAAAADILSERAREDAMAQVGAQSGRLTRQTRTVVCVSPESLLAVADAALAVR